MDRLLGVPRGARWRLGALGATLLVVTLLVGVMAVPASAVVYAGGAITINDNANATPYPSIISVSGTTGTITDVNVTLTGLSSGKADDVDVLLVGPLGQNVVLLADACGVAAFGPVTMTFDDGAAAAPAGACPTGSYKPTAGGGTFGPAPPAPAASSAALSTFNGLTANGSWSLYVFDDAAGGGAGSITSWSVDITGPTTAPTITSFLPTSGPVGTSVVITGTNFTGATSVKFGGVSAVTFTVNLATQITATVPTGAVTGTISVTTPAGTGTSATSFTVTSPTITSFTPIIGPVGTSVTITGTNFTGATAVKFGTVSATFTVNSATQITTTVPTGAITGPISVTTPSGTATSVTSFTVLTPPTITSFTPTSGKIGTSVTITGTNFTGVTAVKFGTVLATFTVNTPTQITTTVPAGANTGAISVTNSGGTATSSASFTVSHERSVSLNLAPKKARGKVSVSDGFGTCASSVPVKVQHLVGSHWRLVHSVTTGSTGSFSSGDVSDPGRYRAIATRVVTATGDVCQKDVSKVVKQ